MIAKLQPRPCKSESQEEGDKFPGKRHGGTKPVKHGSQECMWVGNRRGSKAKQGSMDAKGSVCKRRERSSVTEVR